MHEKQLSGVLVTQGGSCCFLLQLHVKETPSSAIATCASTTRWSAMASRTACTPGTRTTAKVQVEVRGWSRAAANVPVCVPTSREEEAQHPGDAGQHQSHHHRHHMWPGAPPTHCLRHHPAEAASQEVPPAQVQTCWLMFLCRLLVFRLIFSCWFSSFSSAESNLFSGCVTFIHLSFWSQRGL